MDRPEVIDALNRLLQILNRSLPMYLRHAKPWARPNHEKAREALADLAADQQEYVKRISGAVERLGGGVEPGQFPIRFASIHDLAMDFLVRTTIDYQTRSLEAIRGCVDDLADEPSLRLLADRNRIAPAALASRRDLERLAAGERDLEILSGWRGALAGRALLQVLAGDCAPLVADGELTLDCPGAGS